MSKKQNFLVVDTETGGLSCDEHSILSFAGVAWSVDGEPVKCFDLYIKEDDIKYIPKALEINKIKLDELKQVGFSPKEAVFKLREGLDRVFGVNRKLNLGTKGKYHLLEPTLIAEKSLIALILVLPENQNIAS